MYKTTKLTRLIKTIALLTTLLNSTMIVAGRFEDFTCSDCHGIGNVGGVTAPAVRDTSLVGIQNAIATVPEMMSIYQPLLQFGAITEQDLAAISAEITLPSGCTPPQTLVNGVCTVPVTSCTMPQTLVNGVCTTATPTPAAWSYN